MDSLLDLAVDAHGGLERWRQIKRVDFKLWIGGGLWKMKGQPDGLRGVSVQIQAHEPSVVIDPFWQDDAVGFFTPDRVWVENPRNTVLLDRHAPRGALQATIRPLHGTSFTNFTSPAIPCGITLRRPSSSLSRLSRPAKLSRIGRTAKRGAGY